MVGSVLTHCFPGALGFRSSRATSSARLAAKNWPEQR
jgi:hypothetical protein